MGLKLFYGMVQSRPYARKNFILRTHQERQSLVCDPSFMPRSSGSNPDHDGEALWQMRMKSEEVTTSQGPIQTMMKSNEKRKK